MKFRLLLIILFLTSSQSLANRTDWQRVGSGDMRWTVFKLYNISLLTDSGGYQPGDYPQALEIRYFRDIKRKHLIKATDDQWQKLGIKAPQRQRWLQHLQDLWPDVSKGDTLRVEVDAAGTSHFLHNASPLGTLEDAEFSSSFLAIWLSPETSRPELRRRLIQDRQP